MVKFSIKSKLASKNLKNLGVEKFKMWELKTLKCGS